jgi:hypothetical protein
MACLTLWLNSDSVCLYRKQCNELIEAIKNSSDFYYVFQLDDVSPKRVRMTYRQPAFHFSLNGYRHKVPLRSLPRLVALCERVIEGDDAEFEVGLRTGFLGHASKARLLVKDGNNGSECTEGKGIGMIADKE